MMRVISSVERITWRVLGLEQRKIAGCCMSVRFPGLILLEINESTHLTDILPSPHISSGESQSWSFGAEHRAKIGGL